MHIEKLKSDTDDQCTFIIHVCGDLNARTGKANDYVADDVARHMRALPDDYEPDLPICRSSQDTVLNENGSLLINFCRQTGLRIANGRVGDDAAVGKCTYVGSRGSSLIDYVLVSQNLLKQFVAFYVDDPNILSDHCAVNFSLHFRSTADRASFDADGDYETVESKYIWDQTVSDKYRATLNSLETVQKFDSIVNGITNDSSDLELDCCIQNFVSALDSVCKPLFEKPYKKSTRACFNGPRLYSEECEIQKIDFLQKLNLYRYDKSNENRIAMVRARTCFKSSVRKFQYENKVKTTQKLINIKYKNARDYWRLLKSSQNKSGPKTLSAKKFAEYFKAVNDPNSVFFQADEDILDFNNRFLNSELQLLFSELDCEISLNEIIKAIKQLKSGKSGGPDRLLNEFFIHGTEILPRYLYTIFNILLHKGYFPSSWTQGYIVPIHKKGSLSNVENYRGVTLLSCFGKLFTRVINNRLTAWAEEYNVYIEAQAGFRSEMGTVDNIFNLHGLITHLINKGKKLYCAFVDFTKAFDFINRDILWYKLIKYGVSGKLLNVIRSMYEHVKSRVKLENVLSNNFECFLGVRQGECLSPFLFSMYVNDLEEEFRLNGLDGIDIGSLKLLLLLYADDITLFSETEEGLRNGINILNAYCNRWKLKVNISKTKVVVFRKGGTLPRNLKFYYDGQKLEIVSSFSYLGIIFTSGFFFLGHNKH